MVDEQRISKGTFWRWFPPFGAKPHLVNTFKVSNHTFSIEQFRDNTDLYFKPPDHAVVVAVEEKNEIQGQDRTQSIVPLGFAHAEVHPHDYIPFGRTALFADIDLANGKVSSSCRQRDQHQ